MPKSRGSTELQIILILITITFLIVYISRLRIVEGRLYRHLPSNNPILSFVVLIFSLSLLRLILRELEVPLLEREYSSGDILDLFILVVLMFPGTGLAAIVLPRIGDPEWILSLMRRWTYVFPFNSI